MAFPVNTRNPGATATDIGQSGQAYDIIGWSASSTNAAAAFIQVFAKKASTVTVGTTVPDFVINLAATTGASTVALPFGGLHSEAGWSFAVTTTDNGSTAMTYGASINVAWFLQ